MSASAAISLDNRVFCPKPSTGFGYNSPSSHGRTRPIKNGFLSTGTPKEKAQEPTRDALPAVSDTGDYSQELSRMQQLNYYLGSVRDAGDISADTAALALRVWANLSASSSQDLPVPDAAPGPEGQLLYVWNKGAHHLELEIFPNSPAEFFYFNRDSNESWEDEYDVNMTISQQAKDKLSLFTLANG